MLGRVLKDEFTGSGDYSRGAHERRALDPGRKEQGAQDVPTVYFGFKRKSGPRAYGHLYVVPETLQSPCSWPLTRRSPHTWHASECFKC